MVLIKVCLYSSLSATGRVIDAASTQSLRKPKTNKQHRTVKVISIIIINTNTAYLHPLSQVLRFSVPTQPVSHLS